MMKILKNCVQSVEIKSLGITMDSLPVKVARFCTIYFHGKSGGGAENQIKKKRPGNHTSVIFNGKKNIEKECSSIL